MRILRWPRSTSPAILTCGRRLARSGSTPGEGDAGVPVEVADKVSNAGDFVLPTDEDEMVGGEEAFYKNIQGRQ